MATDYSTKDSLPMQQGGDVVDIAVFRSLRDLLDGKLSYVCTSATRPTGGARYTGRVITETDTKRQYVWDGAAWVWLAGGVRQVRQSVYTGSLTDGGSVTTLSIPAQPVACRVDLRATGLVGFSASVNQSIGLDATCWAWMDPAAVYAGALTSQNDAQGVRCAESAQWYGYAWSGYVDLAASTASTITFVMAITGGGNGYFRGEVVGDIRMAGEY